jgi:hypothetical protein
MRRHALKIRALTTFQKYVNRDMVMFWKVLCVISTGVGERSRGRRRTLGEEDRKHGEVEREREREVEGVGGEQGGVRERSRGRRRTLGQEDRKHEEEVEREEDRKHEEEVERRR